MDFSYEVCPRDEPPPSKPLQFVVISKPEDSKTVAAKRFVCSQAALNRGRRPQQHLRPPRARRSSSRSSSRGGATTGSVPASGAQGKQPHALGPASGPTASARPRPEDRAGGLEQGALEQDEVRKFEEHLPAIDDDAAAITAKDGRPSIPEPGTLMTSSKDDPFYSFVRRVSVFEQYLIDYYVTVSLPVLPRLCRSARDGIDDEEALPRSMVVDWISCCLAEPGLLCGLLLAACRRLVALYRDDAKARARFEQMILHYKGELIRSACEALAEEGRSQNISDSTIAKVLSLALDESAVGNHQMLNRHVMAVRQMVEIRGGRGTLGPHGFLAAVFEHFVEPPADAAA